MRQLIQRLSVVMLCAVSLTGLQAEQPHRKGRNVHDTQFTTPLTPRANSNLQRGKVKKNHTRRLGADRVGINAAIDGTVSMSRPAFTKARTMSAAEMPAIYGCIEYSGSRDRIDHTLCRIPTSDGQKFEVIVEEVNAIDGGTAVDDIYYAAYHTEYYGEYQLYINGYDTKTGERVSQRYGDASGEATDVAYNPVDGKIYGCFCDPDSPDYSDYYFGTIDYNTGLTTRISALPRQMAAIAIDASGKIYVIDKQQEKVGYTLTTVAADLYEIDGATGKMTLIGKTGLAPEYRSSACIDPVSGRMFWTVSPADECGYLYEVDTKTGQVQLVYTFPDDEEIVGLYIPAGATTADSPAAVTGLAADFPGGGVEGTVSFTLPATDMNGSPISGNLDWELKANDEALKNGSDAAGTTVSVPVSLREEGMYRFSVTASNDNGPSPETLLTVFVGHDTPVAPQVTASLDGNVVTVTWEPVTAAVNGGYINPEKVTYRVTRYPGATVIAEAATGTSVTDTIELPELLSAYHYTVEAQCSGIVSQPGESAKIIAGHIVPPYTDDFNDIKSFDFYTVINSNGDENKWGPYIGNLQVSYNSSLAMDDWLITPPVMLEAGKAYCFSIDVLTGSASFPETFEVKWGRGNTVDDMTHTVIEKQSVAHTVYVNYRGYIVPEESGLHYVGIHGCSDANMYTLSIDNLAFGSALNAGVPAEATDLNPVSRTNGELRADVSVKAPLTDIAGKPLTSLDRLIVKRDGSPVKTFESPAPGEVLTFVDDVPLCDTYRYSAVAVNASGEGPQVDNDVYVGVLAPSDPSNVKMVETENPGEVTISWDAPATDEKGNALDPQYITYRIYIQVSQTEMDAIYGNITGTSFTFKAIDNADTQEFVQYIVVAETLGGLSNGIPTSMMPVGKPYAAPYRESFSYGAPWSILGSNANGGAAWHLFDDASGIPSADGDNGFIGSEGKYVGDYGSLILGKIDLSTLETPALTFYTYSITDGDQLDENEIEILAAVNGEINSVRTIKISDYSSTDGWVKILVPLTEYAGKTVQLHFVSYGNVWTYTLIDAIRVDNMYDNNLSVTAISAPESVKGGSEFKITAEIENNGLTDARDYTVDLYIDGEKADSQPGVTIPSYDKASFTFTRVIPVINDKPQTVKVVIAYAADEYLADNESEEITVTPVAPTLPAVDAVEAEATDDGITLTWAEPNPADYIPDPVTETFEGATSWATDGAAGWTFVDRDGGGIGGFADGTEFPGIAQGSVQSFFVFDNMTEGFNDYYNNAWSGSKFLASMFSYDYASGNGVKNDDWAISPELCGFAQTISLYARCYDPTYPETFEILYSTGSMDPDDFILAGKYTAASTEWTAFSSKLPDGAKRMAIRCTSDFRFLLFVDDVTFIPRPDDNALILTGYNIYRDGRLAATVDAGVTTFADSEADPSAEHSYMVTALYDKGESRPSDAVTAGMSGIGNISAAAVGIRGGNGLITVENASGLAVSVFTPAGHTVATLTPDSDRATIAAAPGLYIVQAGTTVRKVIVK